MPVLFFIAHTLFATYVVLSFRLILSCCLVYAATQYGGIPKVPWHHFVPRWCLVCHQLAGHPVDEKSGQPCWPAQFRALPMQQYKGINILFNSILFGNVIQIQSNEPAVWSVYEVKWVLFKLIFCHLEMLARSCPLLCSIPRVRAFKWGTVWHSTSRGNRTTRCLG